MFSQVLITSNYPVDQLFEHYGSELSHVRLLQDKLKTIVAQPSMHD